MKIEIKQTDTIRTIDELLCGDIFYLFDNPECPLIYLREDKLLKGESVHVAFDLSTLREVQLKDNDEVKMYRNFKFVGEV